MNAFLKLSGDRYRKLSLRLCEKRNKRGKITQVGRALPFSLEQYRAWLLTVLRTEQGVGRCCYCETPIAIETLVTDHKIPISRSGELTIDNLAACCEFCNDAKGALTDYEFRSLLAALGEIGVVAEANVLSRLAKSEKLAGSHRRMMAQIHKAKPATEENPHPAQYESGLDLVPF